MKLNELPQKYTIHELIFLKLLGTTSKNTLGCLASNLNWNYEPRVRHNMQGE